MDLGLYFAQQLPRPWPEGAEERLFRTALDQVQLADELGFDYAWAPEQHFLAEYSHSSAPEVFLAAASQRTQRIRLGHAVALLPPAYTHPARMAERIATLDLVSGGRIDFGFGDSKSRMELEGFGIDPALRREMSLEAAEQIARMLALDTYPGYDGRFFSMPARTVVPHPVQRPHPPMWMACSDDETARLAARLGVGALIHTFFDADEARKVVDEYYDTFANECVPIGRAVNPAVATLEPFYCHPSPELARERGRAAHGFFTYAVRHYYVFGRHRVGRTDVARDFERVKQEIGGDLPIRGGHSIGTPATIRERLGSLAAAGVDQTILLHQAGSLPPDQVADSMRLFAAEVMPALAGAREERHRRRQELEPAIAAALQRRASIERRSDETVVDAYGLSRPDIELATIDAMPPATREIILELQRLKAIALTLDEE